MEMTTYTATKDFKLPGNPETKIVAGDEVQFDGMNLEVPGNPVRNIPQVRGAIKAGWLVPSEEYTGVAQRPVSAGMTLRPADGGNPMESKPRTTVVTAQEEERHVGNVAQHANQVQENNKLRPGQRTAATVSDVESQDGVPVRHLGNPDGRKNPVDMSKEGGAALAEAEGRKIQPGQGRTREEVMAAMTPEQRAAYEAEIQARRAMHGVLDDQVAIKSAAVAGPDTQGQVVAKVQSSAGTVEKEGMKVTNSVGGGTGAVDLGGTGGQSETTVVEREGIKFVQTNGPKKDTGKVQASPQTLEGDPRRIIAKSMCADFPDLYDFEASPRKKIARIQADFDDRPDIIKAIAAAETDAEMKQRLVEEFPEAFQG